MNLNKLHCLSSNIIILFDFGLTDLENFNKLQPTDENHGSLRVASGVRWVFFLAEQHVAEQLFHVFLVFPLHLGLDLGKAH